MKMNLKLRIFIYFAVAAIIPSLLFWLFIYAELDSKLKSDYRDLSYNSINKYIDEIDLFFEKQSRIVHSIAKSYPYINNSDQETAEFLHKQAEINEHFLNLYIIKTNGELVTNTGRVMKYTDYTLRDSYQRALNQHEIVWLEPYDDEISRLKAVGLAIPVYDKDNEVKGVLVANLTYDFIEDAIANMELLPDAEITLANSGGDITFTTLEGVNAFDNIANQDFILQHISNEILSNTEGAHDFKHKGSDWLCTYATMHTTNWKIIVLYDAKKVIDNINSVNQDLYRSISLFGIAILFLVSFLSIYLSNSISRPLLKLRDGVKELSLGNLDHTISIKGMDEISVVAATFNQMAYNLKRSYSDLFNRTEELYEKNEHLQQVNAELEGSYQQLGAAMEQLNESEEKYRKLIDNISDLVVVINTETQVVYVNSSVKNITGYSEAQLIGRTLKDILYGDLNDTTLMNSFTNDYNEFQLKMMKPDGSLLYLEGSTRRIIEQGRVVAIQAIARDITQRKRIEDELHSRYKELQAINKLTNAVTGTLDLDEMIDVAAEQIMAASEGLCCIVGLMDENSQFVLKAVEGIRLEDKSIVNVDSTKHETQKLIGNKRYLVVEHQTTEKMPNEYFKLLFREEGFRFTLFNPIIAHDKHIGLISTSLRHKPTAELIELITSMANSIGLSIDNAKAYENVKLSYLKTVQSLVSTIEAKDMYTESHSVRVAKYATFIAAEMGMDRSDLEDIWVAGVLHDIGKIGISDSILNKKDKLTDSEYQLIKQHPVIAYKILSNIGLHSGIMNAVRHHHERHDGKGYPDGLAGEDINLLAAIISVADAFDAITSERSYKKPKSLEEGVAEVNAWKGTQFNPQVVDIFSNAFLTKRDVLQRIYEDKEENFF